MARLQLGAGLRLQQGVGPQVRVELHQLGVGLQWEAWLQQMGAERQWLEEELQLGAELGLVWEVGQ